VLIADDHHIVREGIKACLARQRHIKVVGEAVDGQDAVTQTLALRPHVLLMDVTMPRLNGIRVATALRGEAPDVRVLALSVHNNHEYVLQVVRAGACGYVLKDTSPRDLITAIETTARGGTFFSPAIAQIVADDFARRNGRLLDRNPLTSREYEVLRLVVQGCTSKEIARRTGVGQRTVQTHREHIMRKLTVHSTAELTKVALAWELV
jgi:DNA-binding NarL/FixJ family response regulator